MKTALITGVTDGIGRATALILAERGWQIHGIGRSQEKANQLLDQLSRLNPQIHHQISCFDLADITANQSFLDSYLQHNEHLDLLFLNANPLPFKSSLNSYGYHPLFFIGFVSRYLFSTRLNQILSRTPNSRVIHNGQVKTSAKVDFDKLKGKKINGIKAIYHSYTACGYMVRYCNDRGLTSVPHLMLDPGTVDTEQVKSLGPVLRFLAKLYDLTPPEAIAEVIYQHLQTIPAQQAAGQLYYRQKHKQLAGKIDDLTGFEKLMKVAEQITSVYWS